MPLGAALRLLRLVGAECNIHAPADFLKLGNLGAGLFQRVIFRFPLCFEGGIFFLPRGERQGSMVSLILTSWTLLFPLSAIKPIQSGRE